MDKKCPTLSVANIAAGNGISASEPKAVACQTPAS